MDLTRVILLLFIGVTRGKAFYRRQSEEPTTDDELFTPVVNFANKRAACVPHVCGADDSHHYPKELSVILTTAKWNFKLNLHRNELLIPSSFTSVSYKSNGVEIKAKGHPNCFYHGEVEGHSDWSAFISTCNGLSGSFGDYTNHSHLFHIEPFDKSSAANQIHRIHRGTHKQNFTASCGTPSFPSMSLSKLLEKETNMTARSRRQTHGRKLYVELIMVNDFSQYIANNRDLSRTVLRALQAANAADGLYRPLNIRVVLVQSITWSNGNPISVVSDPKTLLDTFRSYLPQIKTSHDAAFLFTGTSLNRPIVGISYQSQMCSSSASIGVVADTRVPASGVGAILAHEMGHLLTMRHDTDSCTCGTPSGCIMSEVLPFPPANSWSSCSIHSLNTGLSTTIAGSCLHNVPTMFVGASVCGNGFREGDEMCDCGSIQECTDPCCNAATCTLAQGAQCASGECCSNCQYLPYSTLCRPADAIGCDIAEYCGGKSSKCPADRRVQDGARCDGGTGFCYSGVCHTVENQCKYFYGPSAQAGYSSCFTDYNTRGDLHGNCGHKNTPGTYASCDPSQVMCGSLQCANTGTEIPSHVDGAGTIQYGSHGTSEETCKSFVFESSGGEQPAVWLVNDGTKCGRDKICLSKQCVPITELNIVPCLRGENEESCSGNGVCNDLGMCSCNFGYGGPACNATFIPLETLSGFK